MPPTSRDRSNVAATAPASALDATNTRLKDTDQSREQAARTEGRQTPSSLPKAPASTPAFVAPSSYLRAAPPSRPSYSRSNTSAMQKQRDDQIEYEQVQGLVRSYGKGVQSSC